MQLYHRPNCRLCNSANVELAVKLEPIPLAEAYSDSPEAAANIPRFPVDLYFCKDCGHVQQLDVVGADALWGNYSYFSGAAKGMPEHFAEIAQWLLADYTLPPNSLVIDIGSNDGSLLLPFRQAGFRVLGVDPASAAAAEAEKRGVPTIVASMRLPLAQDIRKKQGAAQIVCMFNAFAHMDNLQEIAACVAYLLAEDGVFVFEAQYLADILEKKLIATIFHEHMSHHSVTALKPFFERHGLELIDVRRAPIQHGSIIGIVQHKNGPYQKKASVAELLAQEQAAGQDRIDALQAFSTHVQNARQKIRAWAQARKREGAKLAAYGAARSGPTLIAQLGLNDLLSVVFDDNPMKVGRYTSGDGLYIAPTRELYEKMPPYTVILAWVHAAKIIQDNQEYLARGGAFVVLCPEPRLVDKNGEHVL